MNRSQINLMARIFTAKPQPSELMKATGETVRQAMCELAQMASISAIRNYFHVAIHEDKYDHPTKTDRVLFTVKGMGYPFVGRFKEGKFHTEVGVPYSISEVTKWAYLSEVYDLGEEASHD